MSSAASRSPVRLVLGITAVVAALITTADPANAGRIRPGEVATLGGVPAAPLHSDASKPEARSHAPKLSKALKRTIRRELKRERPLARSATFVGDGHIDVDARCSWGAATQYWNGYQEGRWLYFTGMEPRIWPRGMTTQFVAIRWGAAHQYHQKEYGPWRLARVNQYGQYVPFAYYVGFSSSTWWDFSTNRPMLEQNGLSWKVSGAQYQNEAHAPIMQVAWYDANGNVSYYIEYEVPISGKVQACYLAPDGT